MTTLVDVAPTVRFEPPAADGIGRIVINRRDDAVNAINADTSLTPQQKADAIEQANQHIVLQSTTGSGQAENILQAILAMR